MKKYESLTKYLPQLAEGNFGAWIIDNENDGTIEHPLHMSDVSYAEYVDEFVHDVYGFMESNRDMGLDEYDEILEKNGLGYGEKSKSITMADASSLDGQCVMALIVAAIRADRFCEGALLGCLEDGSMQRWLERLKELDEEDAAR